MKLYDYAASANCYKVRLLLAQFDRPYERFDVDIFAGDTLAEEYAAKNPARATPVLALEDGALLTESNAILFYLAQGTLFLPAAPLDLAQDVRWLVFEQTDVMMTMGGLRFRLLTGRLTRDHADAVRRREGALEALGILDRHLQERDFLVAESYSVADIAVYGYTHVAAEAGVELEPFPAVQSWLRRVEEQPRYMNDLKPYPENARPGAGRSTYD
jgi:glutathione S-transferase